MFSKTLPSFVPFPEELGTWDKYREGERRDLAKVGMHYREFVRVNGPYLLDARGDNFWVAVGARSGRIFGAGGHSNYPPFSSKKRMSEEAGEFALVTTLPVSVEDYAASLSGMLALKPDF